MATISNTPRPGYVWDSTDNVWYPIGVGGHSHPDYITQATAVNPTLIDAKGDIITATAADTPARLAVGNNGETLVADSSTSTGLRYQGNFAAGKNKIINGDFGVWQRGTSITTTNGAAVYTADRFTVYNDFSAGSSSFSQQTFAAGTAPVAGYEGTYFGRLTCATTSTYAEIGQRIEDVRQLAGQTATFSFWAKASTNTTVTPTFRQFFGSGGSGNVNTAGSTFAVTTAWQRFSVTLSIPSISGKTIGTGNYVLMYVSFTPGSSQTFDSWGWQVEASNTATAFQTATGTIQGELAACQRYCYRRGTTSTGYGMATLTTFSTNDGYARLDLPVRMRTTPTATLTGTASNYRMYITGLNNLTAIALQEANTDYALFSVSSTGNMQGAGFAGWIASDTGSNGFIQLNAEL